MSPATGAKIGRAWPKSSWASAHAGAVASAACANQRQFARRRSMTLLGRRLDPHEIAPMAVFLASEEAAVITGQSFNVDGGRLLSA